MTPLLWTVLLGSFLAGPVTSDTLFVFSGNVYCNVTSQFKFRTIVAEADFLTHEYLLKDSYHSSQVSPAFYNITTSATHDGWFNGEYEIDFLVLHNCNDKFFFGDTLGFWVRVGEFAITHGTHLVNFDLDITNRGSLWKLDGYP